MSGSSALLVFVLGLVCGGLAVGLGMRNQDDGVNHCPFPTPSTTISTPATAHQGVPRPRS